MAKVESSDRVATLKPKLLGYFDEYQAYHRHPVNRLTHKIAIPLIVFHIVAMLDWVPLLRLPGGVVLTAAHPIYVAVIAWYLWLDARLGIVMAVAYGACFPLAWHAGRALVIGIAIAGWTIQLAGHVVWEKRSPAFLTNLLQALIGPLFFAAILFGRYREPSR